ncbi:MAG: excinuclease ABC subunit UvrA [Planctomycetota bacterium]
MPASDIVIKGAREHNLRNVDLVLPRNQLICLTGVSGSGKSSLAFDTLFAEGQRRYVESLSSYARQFLGQMPKPDVDLIAGLSPSISISQKSAGNNPRSTVGTITEIYDFLRVLFARVGTGHCPTCDQPISAQSREQIIEQILALPKGTRFQLLAPLIRGQKGEYRDLFEDLLKQGLVRARVDGEVVALSQDQRLDRQMRHNIEVVIDRFVGQTTNLRARLAEAVDAGIKLGKGTLIASIETKDGQAEDRLFSVDYSCANCGLSFEPPSPQLFSFNSPQGMCLECDGLGEAHSFDVTLLIPDDRLSIKKGCFELLGKWREISRWRRTVYQGVAQTIERTHQLPEGTMLETPWRELDESLRELWLWGTGKQHITFTWRGGNSPIKYGGTFDGIIPELLSKYRNSKSRIHLLKLEQYMRTMECPACHGQRLNPLGRSFRITTRHSDFKANASRTLPEICHLPIEEAAAFFSELQLDTTRAAIAKEALKEIRGRLGFLTNVGLSYLSLDRTAPTLSGGETQRIRLAGQIGCGLVGVLYILDEPSIGLHPRDNDRLLETLTQLRDMGNTVVVVEHDEDTMRHSDHVIDFGPGPGVRGGHVVARGTVDDVMQAKTSVTGQYLAGKREIAVPKQRRPLGAHALRVLQASHNNLKSVDVTLPLGAFICVTGVSGSGKSSLVNDILVEALRRDLNNGNGEPGTHEAIEGLEHLDKMIAIDQTPIGRTPRSNPGTYIKVFDEIRKLYTQLPDSKRRGYKPGRFSFNVDGGRCQACDGNGSNRLEMDFLADIWVTCPVCEGHRFNRETLGVKFKDHSIADVLEMDIQQLLKLFTNMPSIHHKLKTLHDVGLDYLKLGQPSPTLSGGEAQRIKLARELVKKSTGSTLYLLDEPTTGLHFADIQMLLKVLHDFVEAGNTVLVVEHNLDVIKTADWIIDLGPEGGGGGGQIVVAGTPEQVAKCPESHTGKALRGVLRGTSKTRRPSAPKANGKPRRSSAPLLCREISVNGARQHNLKDVSVTIPREEMTVFCGPSGSGKSSLAMDTIYAEGQRRYVESLSAYARQFVSQMQKPELESIEGLSPAIAIEQQNLGSTPRSTVGTTTEIYDYLRILFSRLGTPYCPDCDLPVGTQSADEIIDKIMKSKSGTRAYLMAPVRIEVGQQYEVLWEELREKGYIRVRVDGTTYNLDEVPSIDRRRKHVVETVVDRIVIRKDNRSRIAESVEAALAMGEGLLHLAIVQKDVPETEWRVEVHNQHLACDACGRSFEALSPHHFSFNSHLGWCPSCEGLGTQTGANPKALLRDPGATLADGALLLWPNLDRKVSRLMLTALSKRCGIPLDVPFENLPAHKRRLVLHGTGSTWIEVMPPGRKTKKTRPMFRFQFKGLYPALDEAARLSASLRGKLNHLIDEVECSACSGSRLRDDAAAMRFQESTIDQLCTQPLAQLQTTVAGWKLNASQRKVAGELLREIRSRVDFLNDVGLTYLTLARTAVSLSGGEAQRIRLASQLGSGLCGVLYVLDEPTIGLHPRDNGRLLKALHRLRDLGNTMVIVEHDRDVIAGSDYVMDFGPRAGKHGGEVVAAAAPTALGRRKGSVTGPYITGKKAIPVPANRRPVEEPVEKTKASKQNAKGTRKSSKPKAPKPQPKLDWLTVRGARHHNLKDVDVTFPLGRLVAISGPSGSGKSSLVIDVLHAALASRLSRARQLPGAHERIDGIEHINKVIRVDQQPLGNTPTSNPVTYTGAFDPIRQLFAQMPESKLRGYTQRRFSFNVPGGRCEECEGAGQQCIEMHFLPDVWVECEACRGQRYNRETLDVLYRGHSISDVLNLTCGEGLELFANVPKIRRILQTLCDVGLDYLTLGQPAPTLSGGEAQRVKLASELSRPDTGRTLYLLDEPTTGLHFDDLAKLLEVMQRLVDVGNSVLVIEHNLDIIKSADWVIDMGPEAGADGGQLVIAGTPEAVVEAKGKRPRGRKQVIRSHTAEALAPVLAAGPTFTRKIYDPHEAERRRESDLEIKDIGKAEKMPWEADGKLWHTQDRVGRKGDPCEWDGEILEWVEGRIQELGNFTPTNWNSRTVVEIVGNKKSDGWFFHAITGETWLLKLKFRVTRNTFKREALEKRFKLKTLNEMDDIPMYSNEPRVKCKNLRGPWQEVEFRLFSLDEARHPEFERFLQEAVAGFEKISDRAAANPEDVMPWKVMGQKWHLSRKGFPPGKKVKWQVGLLEELLDLLDETAGDGQFLWNNQVLVHRMVKGLKEPWATVLTKKLDQIELHLRSPKGEFALGQILDLGRNPTLETDTKSREVVKIQFQKRADLSKGNLRDFLKSHLEAMRA